MDALQQNTANIRNICILAHVDHGKTTLSDSLLASNGIISSKLAGKMRYLDSRPDEQERGITMKSSGISLVFSVLDSTKHDYLVNLIDSPGHVDFSSEVSTASRLCDGALVLVDCVEGICSQTHAVLLQAWQEGVKPILVLNKIDRLIVELRLSPMEAYDHLQQIVEQANAILGALYSETLMENAAIADDALDFHFNDEFHDSVEEESIYFAPVRGNVLFASAVDGWAFRTSQFAQLYASKLGIRESLLNKVLWGNYYLDTKLKRVVSQSKLLKSNKQTTIKPIFVQFVLENIWAAYNAVVVDRDPVKMDKIIKTLNLKVLPRELKSKDVKSLIQSIMTQWLPLSRAVLLSVIQHVPSPVVAQKLRLPSILHPEAQAPFKGFSVCNDKIDAHIASVLSKLTNNTLHTIEKAIYKCDSSSSAPTVVYISKMFSVSEKDLPKVLPVAATPEEMRLKRQEIIERSKRLEASTNTSTTDESWSVVDGLVGGLDGLDVAAKVTDKEVLLGFARIFSGSIRVGQKLHILDPKYDASKPHEHHSEATIDRLFLMMGRDLQDLEVVPAGNIFAVMGVQEHVLKAATVSSSLVCPSLAGVRRDAAPIVRVALEPTVPSQLNQLIEGMKLLDRADPCVQVLFQDTGENIIVCAGELHLERCLRDLRDRFANISIQASAPIVPFRETLSFAAALKSSDENEIALHPTGTVVVTTRDKGLEIRIRVVPLPPLVRTFLHDHVNDLQEIERLRVADQDESDETMQDYKTATEDFVSKLSDAFKQASKEGQHLVTSGVKMDYVAMLDGLVAIGPKVSPTNLLVCACDTYEMTHWTNSHQASKASRRTEPTNTKKTFDYEHSILSGFLIGTQAGPLCAEPMSGTCVIIDSINLSVHAEKQSIAEEEYTITQDVDYEGMTASSVATSAVAAQSGQIISLVRDACRQGFLSWSPRLMLAMYSCDLQTPLDILGKVYAVLNRRRGRIVSEDMKEGTPFFNIISVMPVVESFGFSDELRKRTSGAAVPQLLFSGFEVLDQDPFWVPNTEEELEDLGEKADRENQAKKYMDAVRRRKGMAIDKKVVEHGEKQRTMKY